MKDTVDRPLIIIQIRSRLPYLNGAAAKVAQFYLCHTPQECATMHIGQVAACSGTSEATVTRFVKQMGAESFRSFRESFLTDVHNRRSLPQTQGDTLLRYADVQTSDSPQQLCGKVVQSHISAIMQQQQILQHDQIDQAARAIYKSEKTLLVGNGRSGLVAAAMDIRLKRLGLASRLCTDMSNQYISASTAEKNDVLLAFAKSGRARSIVLSMAMARQRGATTILVTSDTNSPAARSAEILIPIVEEPIGYDHSFLTVILMLVSDCIAMRIYALLNDAEYKKVLRARNRLP